MHAYIPINKYIVENQINNYVIHVFMFSQKLNM